MPGLAYYLHVLRISKTMALHWGRMQQDSCQGLTLRMRGTSENNVNEANEELVGFPYVCYMLHQYLMRRTGITSRALFAA